MTALRILSAFLLLLAAMPAFAVQPDEILDDAVLEERARNLSTELRCLVCQNQSIDDSDAPLARDLRILIRERLLAGDSDEAVIDFVVVRYGEFVLLRPPFVPHNWALWFAAPVLFLAGVLAIIAAYRRRSNNRPAEEAPLSADERSALERILKE